MIIEQTTTDHGICLIDVYCSPGDLNDAWDIVQQNPDGTFPRNPDAGYGPDARDRDTSTWGFKPQHVTEVYTVTDRNGWSEREVEIFADGKFLARQKY